MYLLEMKIGSLMRVCYSTMVATNFSRNFSNTRKNFPRIFFFFSPVRISMCTTIFDFSFHFFSSYFATIFRAYRKSIFAIWSKKKILSEKKKKRKKRVFLRIDVTYVGIFQKDSDFFLPKSLFSLLFIFDSRD